MLAACAALFSGCGSSGGGTGPRGWNHAAGGLWTDPRSKQDEFRVTSEPYDGTLKDLASLTTTNLVLRTHAKLDSAAAFSPCPALAGLQGFTLPDGTLAKVAFAVRNGRRIQAEYVRSAEEPVDPAAIDALAANVCALP
jgi:hypothetical protein